MDGQTMGSSDKVDCTTFFGQSKNEIQLVQLMLSSTNPNVRKHFRFTIIPGKRSWMGVI